MLDIVKINSLLTFVKVSVESRQVLKKFEHCVMKIFYQNVYDRLRSFGAQDLWLELFVSFLSVAKPEIP